MRSAPVPEAARARRPDFEVTAANVQDVAAQLKQQSRFLRRQSDRLRGHSNDLLTVAMFQRLNCRPTSDDRRAHLKLLP